MSLYYNSDLQWSNDILIGHTCSCIDLPYSVYTKAYMEPEAWSEPLWHTSQGSNLSTSMDDDIALYTAIMHLVVVWKHHWLEHNT